MVTKGKRGSLKIGTIILAAGYSSRMNAFKPLLPVGGKTAVSRLAEASMDAGINRIMVVTGYRCEAIREELARIRGDVASVLKEAYNADFDDGMFSSIKCGLAKSHALWPDADGFFLMPVDCPLVSSAVLKHMMETVVAAGEDDLDATSLSEGNAVGTNGLRDFFVPVFEGKKGHPLFIPKRYVDEICDYDGPGGLKAITDQYWDRMERVSVDEEGCVLDMDTPEGYREIEAFLQNGCRRQALRALAAGRRIFLIRHGETQQHAEKMFIGRYDVPLSERGKEDVKEMAGRLAGTLQIKRIYVSPLQRAVQTAEILQETLEALADKNATAEEAVTGHKLRAPQELELCTVADLQEISLGDWDGRKISEIKEKYPDAYRRRGEDMFTFKIGNKAENFYDVQYRAVRALRKILQEDDARDIVLVTHNAVIRALENNLRGLRVDDIWEKLPKGGFVVVEP